MQYNVSVSVLSLVTVKVIWRKRSWRCGCGRGSSPSFLASLRSFNRLTRFIQTLTRLMAKVGMDRLLNDACGRIGKFWESSIKKFITIILSLNKNGKVTILNNSKGLKYSNSVKFLPARSMFPSTYVFVPLLHLILLLGVSNYKLQ